MLRLTLSKLGVWQTPFPSPAAGMMVSVRGKKGGKGGGKATATSSVVEADSNKLEDALISMEPFTPREAAPRSDTEYDEVNPSRFVKHKKTLEPRRYVANVDALEESALCSEINPSGERYVSKLVLSVKGSCYATLRSYIMYAKFAAECLDIKTTTESGKLLTGVYTINRSPFVHGEHKDRYKRDIWNRKLILHRISGTTADVFLSYVQRNIPSGVTMAVTEQRLVDIPQDFLSTFYTKTNNSVFQHEGLMSRDGNEMLSSSESVDVDQGETKGSVIDAPS